MAPETMRDIFGERFPISSIIVIKIDETNDGSYVLLVETNSGVKILDIYKTDKEVYEAYDYWKKWIEMFDNDEET